MEMLHGTQVVRKLSYVTATNMTLEVTTYACDNL